MEKKLVVKRCFNTGEIGVKRSFNIPCVKMCFNNPRVKMCFNNYHVKISFNNPCVKRPFNNTCIKRSPSLSHSLSSFFSFSIEMIFAVHCMMNAYIWQKYKQYIYSVSITKMTCYSTYLCWIFKYTFFKPSFSVISFIRHMRVTHAVQYSMNDALCFKHPLC